ncbi:MAG: hypothetical protein E4H16_03465, partial [Candidatus Atribacteria bacterium]
IVLSGRFPPGGYQIYASAFILFQLPYAIFAVSIFTALLPAMSGRWADDDPPGVRTLSPVASETRSSSSSPRHSAIWCSLSRSSSCCFNTGTRVPPTRR